MNVLRAEIGKQNKWELTAQTRYLTKPSNREGKTHWSIVIALRNREAAKQMIQRGTYNFSFIQWLKEYHKKRVTDHFTQCHGYEHMWQRCKATKSSCMICTGKHSAKDHVCNTCSFTKAPWPHHVAKYGNWYGP